MTMSAMLSGKNAIVTGANRGIGLAVLRLFAASGCNVWACCRKPSEAFTQEAAQLQEKHSVWIEPVYFDLQNSEEMKSAVKLIREKKEKVDILVNNAGIEQKGSLFQMTSMDVFRQIFEVNVFAQIEFSRYITNLMMRNRSGSVVNLISVAGLDMTGGYMAYSASKAAMASVTKTMAAELCSYGIRVNGVAPGIAQTDMAMGLTEQARENTKAASLMQRIAAPEEIAAVIRFLASDDASYMTGQIVRADGGMA